MPKQKLTQTYVDGVSKPKTRVIIWDSEIPGYGLRVTPTGAKSFILQHRLDPKSNPRKWTLGKAGVADGLSARDARAKALEYLSAVREGLDPEAALRERKAAPTVDDLIERFMRGREERVRTTKNEWSIIENHIRPAFGKMRVMDLTRQEVINWHHKIGTKPGPKGKPAPTQANRP